MKLGGELLPVFREQRFNGPVLDRLERANLALPFYQQSQCNSLDTSGGDSLLDRFPENWAGFIADQSVQNATRLLGVDFSFVDFASVLDRQLYRITRDLVEQHASDRRPVLRFDLLRDVPGDRFALTIGVGRQKDFA